MTCYGVAGVRLYIIIFPVNYSRWVRAFSCRVAAHETDSLDDCGGGVGGVGERRIRSTLRIQYRNDQAGEGKGQGQRQSKQSDQCGFHHRHPTPPAISVQGHPRKRGLMRRR